MENEKKIKELQTKFDALPQEDKEKIAKIQRGELSEAELEAVAGGLSEEAKGILYGIIPAMGLLGVGAIGAIGYAFGYEDGKEAEKPAAKESNSVSVNKDSSEYKAGLKHGYNYIDSPDYTAGLNAGYKDRSEVKEKYGF